MTTLSENRETASENIAFAITRGRRKAAEVFAAMPGRRYIVTTTTHADFVCGLLKCAHPSELDRGLAQARRAVAYVAVCKLHDTGSFTRFLMPIFPAELPGLGGFVMSTEEQAARIFYAMAGAREAFAIGTEYRAAEAWATDLAWVAP